MKYFKDNYLFIAPAVKRKTAKYDAYTKDGKYITSFGSRIHEQYFDKIGHYSSKNHNSSKRRALYYKRFGKQAKKESAKWYSHKFLW